MQPSSRIVLKHFLRSSDDEDILLGFLSEEEKRLLQEMTFEKKPIQELILHNHLLESVHYSWFLPTLKSYEKEAPAFIAIFSKTAKLSLEKALNIPPMKKELSKVAKLFLKDLLLKSLIGEKKDLLPIEFLPPSSMNALLNLRKNQLLDLIQYLSLYDLSLELKQIVETKIVKKILSFLSEDEQKFLQIKRTYQESGFVPMNLDRWDGKEESMKKLLHKRGLIRLAKALHFQSPDLLWYIAHYLDIGRGIFILSLKEKDLTNAAVSLLEKQVVELLSLFKPKTPKTP
jgi:hypothetical protein